MSDSSLTFRSRLGLAISVGGGVRPAEADTTMKQQCAEPYPATRDPAVERPVRCRSAHGPCRHRRRPGRAVEFADRRRIERSANVGRNQTRVLVLDDWRSRSRAAGWSLTGPEERHARRDLPAVGFTCGPESLRVGDVVNYDDVHGRTPSLEPAGTNHHVRPSLFPGPSLGSTCLAPQAPMRRSSRPPCRPRRRS